jgi:hypothetical protein
MNAAYQKLGLDPKDTTVSSMANKVLEEAGYTPGVTKSFFDNVGGYTGSDAGINILIDRYNQQPTEQDLIDAGLDPDEYSVVHSNAAEAFYVEEKLKEMGANPSSTKAIMGSTARYLGGDQSSLGMQGARSVEDVRSETEKLVPGRDEEKFLDIYEWDLIKKKAEDKKKKDTGYTVGSPTATVTGGTFQTPGSGQITGGGTGTYGGPNFVSTPNIGAITPIYGGDQTGTTEVDIPTYEAGLGKQKTQFDQRAIDQAAYYKPQTLEEQTKAGTAPAFENVMYRNRFGMTTYIQHINGVPSQPIPPGYFRVQGFGTQAETQGGSAAASTGAVTAAQGGMIQGFNGGGSVQGLYEGGLPEGVTIKKYGNRYGFADPFGNQIKFTSPEGYDESTFNNEQGALDAAQYLDYVKSALEPYSPYSGNVNPALNYQPGGQIIQADGGYKIQYPGEGGATSQLYSTYGQALSANQSGLSGLGLPDYNTYLANQGVDTSSAGYDPTAYQEAYQSYISNPATLSQMQAEQEAANQVPQEATVNQDFISGTQTVTGDDLAQYQRNLAAQAYAAPGGAVAAAPTSYIDPNAYGTVMESTAGQALPTAPMVQEDQVAQISSATTADTPQKTGAGQVTAQQAFSDIQNATAGMDAAQMTGGPTQTITAAQDTGTSVSNLQAATGQSVDVTGAPTRTEQAGEMITGTGVDQAQVGAAFGTGEVQAASVQDELTGLMAQFEGGETPAWAAGSMRKASQMLAARGLGASSMAGQAVIQAAMEAALPIAQIDAGNKQQMALFKAEQRAKFLQMDFDQAFQAKVMNAAKVSEIANMNFTAEQQIALENSKAANTMALQNLTNKQAMVMAEAAALSQMDVQNLNNRQQAAVQNAQNFLQVDMANLNNNQQTALFKQQALVNSILSDQAAANAAQQFNATSQNQTDQFFANLGASVNQFNAAQINAMKQFNADEVNSLLEFNAQMQNQREMFNAQNYLVVAQANAQWRQNLTTVNTAAANEANMEYAQTVNGLTLKALDQIWQRERDLMDYSFTSSESAADRALNILLADKTLQGLREQIEAEEQTALGGLLTKVFFSSDFKSIFE